MQTLESRKLQIIQRVLGEVNDPLLSQIESLIGIDEEIVCYTISGEPLTKAAYNKELELAEQEIESGNFYTQEEVEKISSEWRRKS